MEMPLNDLLRLFQDRLPLFYVFLSGIGFSYQTLVIKLLMERGFHGSLYLPFTRGVMQLFLSSGLIYFSEERKNGTGPKLFGNSKFVTWMLFVRSFTGFLGISSGFLSTEMLSIGDSTVLVMLSPTIASLLGYLILGEPWRLPEFIGTVLSFLGVVFIARPESIFGSTFQENTDKSTFYIGVCVALFCAMVSACVFISIRILGTSAKTPWPYVNFSQSLGQIILSPLTFPIFGVSFHQPITTTVVLFLLSGGIVGAFSQIAMTVGMQREKSAAASAMRMSDVIFGFLWQILFTPDPVDKLSIFGALLVSLSILVVVIFKQENPENSGVATTIEMTAVKDGKDKNNSKSVVQSSTHQYEKLAQSDVVEEI
jgi:drug/metabolite transporter (DMT)-like permease